MCKIDLIKLKHQLEDSLLITEHLQAEIDRLQEINKLQKKVIELERKNMSIIHCKKCNRQIDTDTEEYMFDNMICKECHEVAEELLSNK